MTDKNHRQSRRRRPATEHRRSGHKKALWKKALLITVLSILFFFLAGAGLFTYYASQAPELNEESLVSPVASEILDKNGEVIATIGTQQRDIVAYEDIPALVENAVLATEDSRFYSHIGVDPIRLGGAVIANLTEGIGSEGGSTLTQQLVKRAFLTSEKTLERKAQEAWLSLKLENQYSKEQIFRMYVNRIYYSDNIYGIQTASRYYFNKDLEELSLPQAALLAGIPQSPNNYNPYDYPERAKERRDIVLLLMEQHGKITEQEMKEAQQFPITEGLVSRSSEERRTLANRKGDEAFIDVVLNEVNQYGNFDLPKDGLKIHTTMDPDAQEYMEKLLNTDEIISYPDNKKGQPFQAGVTLVDTRSGAVQAVGGGRNYGETAQRGYNFATDTERQPGSAIKPLLVYAPAIEKMQWSTAHILTDEPIEYENGNQPRNWDDQFKGAVSIREALRESRNIPAIKAFNQTGHEYAGSFIEELGLEVDQPLVESSAIGGSDFNTNSYELAGAYAALGNNGVYTEPFTITQIELRDGTTIDTVPESTKAMEPHTAYLVTDMLKDVLEHPDGTANRAAISDLPVAGKSGTTNYSKEMREKFDLGIDDAPDSWFAGYTTNYTIAIWTGYEDKENFLIPAERQTAQEIFHALMSYVSEDIETPDFEKPTDVVEAEIEAGTNPPELASRYTPAELIKDELFIEGTVPDTVSDQYVPALQAPKNLSASYNRSTQSATLNWDHFQEEIDNRQVRFEITMARGNESGEVISTTTNEEVVIENIQPDETYTFTITAVTEDEKSDSRIIRVETQVAEAEGQPDPVPEDNNEAENPEEGNDGSSEQTVEETPAQPAPNPEDGAVEEPENEGSNEQTVEETPAQPAPNPEDGTAEEPENEGSNEQTEEETPAQPAPTPEDGAAEEPENEGSNEQTEEETPAQPAPTPEDGAAEEPENENSSEQTVEETPAQPAPAPEDGAAEEPENENSSEQTEEETPAQPAPTLEDGAAEEPENENPSEQPVEETPAQPAPAPAAEEDNPPVENNGSSEQPEPAEETTADPASTEDTNEAGNPPESENSSSGGQTAEETPTESNTTENQGGGTESATPPVNNEEAENPIQNSGSSDEQSTNETNSGESPEESNPANATENSPSSPSPASPNEETDQNQTPPAEESSEEGNGNNADSSNGNPASEENPSPNTDSDETQTPEN